jgi:hypothetical protein
LSHCQKSTSACVTGWQAVERTSPDRLRRVPAIPPSTSEVRSGELGVKYGPSVWEGVASSSSAHCAVGESVAAGEGDALVAITGDESASPHAPSPSTGRAAIAFKT